ncbi:hypothetical protein RSAG8_05836, partial [Rhizoctonia solani AG-8 WAC10335]
MRTGVCCMRATGISLKFLALLEIPLPPSVSPRPAILSLSTKYSLG